MRWLRHSLPLPELAFERPPLDDGLALLWLLLCGWFWLSGNDGLERKYECKLLGRARARVNAGEDHSACGGDAVDKGDDGVRSRERAASIL